MSLQSEILDALEVPGWDDSIAAVKHTVVNALHRLDRSAQISDTGYFNHSFVPDFVLTWATGAAADRDVFLRLDGSAEFIGPDLRYLAQSHPVLLGLAGVDTSRSSDSELSSPTLDATARDSKTLITEPSALERLATERPESSFSHVLPSAMLKGGQGVVETDVAVRLSEASDTFFASAREHDAVPLQGAVPLIQEHLNRTEERKLVNLGRIVWEATGGEPTQFPITTDLSGVDDAGLRFLLEEAPADDAAFWRSVGRLVTLERLLGLGIRIAPNLSSFVRANADQLYARFLMVRATQPRLGQHAPRWSIDGGTLTLTGSNFAAHVASRRDDVQVKTDQANGLDLPTFRQRIRDELIETVTITTTSGKTVEIHSAEVLDPSTDEVLTSVGELPGALIQRVGLTVAGRHLECDFTARTASGHTNARFEVSVLLDRALPLLWPLNDELDLAEVQLVRDASTLRAEVPTLFDQND